MDKPMAFDQVGLEIYQSSSTPAYWKIRVLNYNQSNQNISCEILGYYKGEMDLSTNQKFLAETLGKIQKIFFTHVSTEGLLLTLKPKPISIEANQSLDVPQENDISAFGPSVSSAYQLNDSFTILIKDLQFRLGGVAFEKKIKGFSGPIDFFIENYEIREEFDAVKNYFANVLGKKRISVTVSVDIIGDQVKSRLAKSPEIDKINKDLIENVKFEFIKTTKKKVIVDIDKSLFTMDESSTGSRRSLRVLQGRVVARRNQYFKMKQHLIISFSILIILIESACSATKQHSSRQVQSYVPASRELYDTIARMDSILFGAFNSCDIERFTRLLTDDIEFYHDQSGLMLSSKTQSEGLKMRCAEQDKNGILRRELVTGSLEVYPIANYGAIEIGIHNFYRTLPGQKERLTTVGKFMNVWQKKNGLWQVSRIFSYDHREM